MKPEILLVDDDPGIRFGFSRYLAKSGFVIKEAESVETTQIYLDANLAIKEEILAKTTPINAKKKGRYRPDDDLLTFLKGL